MFIRSIMAALFLTALSTAACVHRPPLPADIAGTGRQAIVETSNGPVAGVTNGEGLSIFLGIPYAKAPTGDLRFMPPREPDPWKEPRPATNYGPVCPQEETEIDPSSFYTQSEDCLSLNVWTPAADGAKRPVLVFIHGGGFFLGSSARSLYDGAAFAKRGDIVFVSINYRLGALGFLYLDNPGRTFEGGGGNMGLLDQTAALSWVKNNIGKFGGDPDNVTIMGQSAGSISVTTLMTMPSAKGLFGKVIAQSGMPGMSRTVLHAEEGARRFVKIAGVKEPSKLRTLPVDRLLKAQTRLIRAEGVNAVRAFMPVVDGRILPKDPMAVFAAGGEAQVPMLQGTTRDEFRFWLYIVPIMKYVSVNLLLDAFPDIRDKLGDSKDRIVSHYKKAHGLKRGDLSMALATDVGFWIPHVNAAELHSRLAPVYMYEFDWPTPVNDGVYGSHHGLELPFVFHNIGREDRIKSLGPNPPAALADAMNDAWLSFVKGGAPKVPGLPDWPAYDLKTRATMMFDEQSRIANDPKQPERLMYKGVIY